MSEIFIYLPEHFDVVKSEGNYGPVWEVTPTAGPLFTAASSWLRKFVLKADFEMNKAWMDNPRPGVHVYETFSTETMHTRGGDFQGIYRTGDMDEAFSWLIGDINQNMKLTHMRECMSSTQHSLSDAIDEIDAATQDFPNLDLDATMQKISDAYNALMVAYTEARQEVESL